MGLLRKTSLTLHLQIRGGGVYSDLVWVGMGCWEFESRPILTPIFLEKVVHSYTNCHNFSVKFWPETNQSSQNVHFLFTCFDAKLHHLLKFAPIWNTLLKILNNGPIHIPQFVKKKQSLIYQWDWFCYLCLWHVPIPTFVPSIPRGSNLIFCSIEDWPLPDTNVILSSGAISSH